MLFGDLGLVWTWANEEFEQKRKSTPRSCRAKSGSRNLFKLDNYFTLLKRRVDGADEWFWVTMEKDGCRINTGECGVGFGENSLPVRSWNMP